MTFLNSIIFLSRKVDIPTSSSGKAASGQIFDPQYDGYLQGRALVIIDKLNISTITYGIPT